MEVVKMIILVVTITMALSVTLTMKSFEKAATSMMKTAETTSIPMMTEKKEEASTATLLASRSVSRFLAEEKEKNRGGASGGQCKKDNKMCERKYGKGWECCNNKCVDLRSDKHNCGGCKTKCKYTGECCRGRCVDVAYDKRHCGRCNNACLRGKFCVYGMCEYA